MIEVSYDNSIENEALLRAREMVKSGLFDRMGFTYGQRINKAKIGCIGELAFGSVLSQLGIIYETDNDGYVDRNSDDFDFKVNGKFFDVKVAKTNHMPHDEWTYGYPVGQTHHYKDFIVVGAVNENERVVRYYGWIAFSQLMRYPITKINGYAKFDYSTDNYEFQWGDLNKDFDSLWRTCNE